MFAEDTGLIPKKSFSALLNKVRDRPENLKPQLSGLWQAMDKGGFTGALGEAGETVVRFNGYLFKDRTAIDLTSAEIGVLIEAAKADWRQVEPAIFGTLLERALNPKDRAKLGAHYTPRTYVERLVQPTIMEPLREDWLGVRTAATEAAEAGDKEGARKIVEKFHTKLAKTYVLDPACGTGNFLYVAMARMKELEGEVVELLEELGDRQYLAELSGHTITPENFLGIEINPRAAEIAQLVLWIGYLQWHFKVNGDERMPEPPVLRDIRTIECRDALIDYDRKELEKDQYGRPVSRWDGETTTPHPVTGKPVPDETARLEVYRYVNPRAARWPKADFIIGNPPFIGNKRMRKRVGDGYVTALRKAWPRVPANTDFVMYWWDHAATLARKFRVRAFGFVSTNSIKQISNRAVVNTHRSALDPLSITFAVPDHPWLDPETDAAVRVAFTVGRGGKLDGVLKQVLNEQKSRSRSEAPTFEEVRGTINADLSVGSDTTVAPTLKSNASLAYMGVIPVGLGFRLDLENYAVIKELRARPT